MVPRVTVTAWNQRPAPERSARALGAGDRRGHFPRTPTTLPPTGAASPSQHTQASPVQPLCSRWTWRNTRTIPETLVPGPQVLGPAHGPRPCPPYQMALRKCTWAATHKPRRSETPLLNPHACTDVPTLLATQTQALRRGTDSWVGCCIPHLGEPSAGSGGQALVGTKHVVYKH